MRADCDLGCAECRAALLAAPMTPTLRLLARGRSIAGGWGTETAAYIAIAAAVLGTAVSAYGSYAASQQQSAALQYNAAVQYQQGAYQQQLAELQAKMIERQALGVQTLAEAQAVLSEQQAIAAEAAGRVRAAAIRRAYDRTQSEVRAAIGKSGVDTTGSPLLVLLENADTVGQELALNEYQTALDVAGAKGGAAYARAEGALRAGSLTEEAAYHRFGGQAGAAGAASAANLLNFQAAGARTAGAFNVGSTLLSGAGQIGSTYSRFGFGSGGGGGGMPGYRMPRFG